MFQAYYSRAAAPLTPSMVGIVRGNSAKPVEDYESYNYGDYDGDNTGDNGHQTEGPIDTLEADTGDNGHQTEGPIDTLEADKLKEALEIEDEKWDAYGEGPKVRKFPPHRDAAIRQLTILHSKKWASIQSYCDRDKHHCLHGVSSKSLKERARIIYCSYRKIQPAPSSDPPLFIRVMDEDSVNGRKKLIDSFRAQVKTQLDSGKYYVSANKRSFDPESTPNESTKKKARK
jgi:hypothetical protein